MDFTKIVPLEYNGQAVIPTKWLTDFLSEEDNITNSRASGRVQLGKAALFDNLDYFALRGITASDFSRRYAEIYPRPVTNLCLFTESGVRKLAKTDFSKSLKTFYEKVFGGLIDDEPPVEENTADTTALTPFEVFDNEQFGKIRVVVIDGTTYFVGKDVAAALGYKDIKHAILDHVDEEDRINSKTQGQNAPEFGQRGTWLINESGLYSLFLSSKLPDAKKFKRWVTAEVLPAIRERRTYSLDSGAQKEMPFDFEIAIDKAISIQDKLKRLIGKGVREEMVLAQSIYAAEKFYNQDLDFIRKCVPAATHEIGYMNATEAGKKLGLSAKGFNDLVIEKGMAFRDEKKVVRLTELGKRFAELKPFEKNGYSDYQIAWTDKAIDFLTQATPSLFK